MPVTTADRVTFNTRNSTYDLVRVDDRVDLVRAGQTIVAGVIDVITHYPNGRDVRWPVREFLIGVAQDDAVHATATFRGRHNGWQVTTIQPRPRDVDPTAFPIAVDPREQRMRGVTVHGNMAFDVPFISEILPGLWVGGCEDGLALPPGIDRVLSLYPWERYTLTAGQERVEMRMYDAGLPPVAELEEAADQIAAWRDEGHQVLVHCQAGLNRSNLVLGYYLVTRCCYTGEWVRGVLRDRRSPASLCNRAFEEYLLELTPALAPGAAMPYPRP